MAKQILLINMGVEPYKPVWDLQHLLVDLRRQGRVGDVLLLLEHAPVITLGRNADESHILVSQEFLAQQGIEVYRVERGGDVTYHGPGQLVGYPILDLTQKKQDVGWYVRSLEEVLIQALGDFGIQASRVAGAAGVWVGDRKIAAIGARIENWITYHGFALNIAPNIRHWQLIVPCGIEGKDVTTMDQVLRYTPDTQEVRKSAARHFGEVFGVEVREASLAELLPEELRRENPILVS